MAKVNLYIPDPLKAEMELLGERVNWSSVAQSAFDLELQPLRFPKEPTMEAVVERLKASKFKADQHDRAEGLVHGKEWGMKKAEFAELRTMASINFDYKGDLSSASYTDSCLGIEGFDPTDSFWFDPENNSLASDAYVEAFVDGAKQIWLQVKDKLI